MKVRAHIADDIYDPVQLKLAGKAFDDAWAQISQQISNRPKAIEAARLKLAEMVLSLIKNGTTDPQKLTEAAIHAMLAGH